ncbi:MAG: radical SAM protein, partial [Candidatus Aminicenantes bacterium]
FVDLVVQGEGEEAFYNILERIKEGIFDFNDVSGVTYKSENKIIDNPPSYQYRLEDQDYELNLEDFTECEYFYYETSRGCPFKCCYCLWDKRPKRKIRVYSLNKVKRDLQQIFRLLKLKFLTLIDSNLLLKRDRALEIFRLLNQLTHERAKKKLEPLNFTLETPPEYLDEEIIKELVKFLTNRRDTSSFGYGLQTINPNTLKTMNRRLNLGKFTQNVRKAREMGLKKTLVEIIHGLPGDTLDSFKKTLDYLISELNVENFHSLHFYLIPNSFFWRHAKEYGLAYEPKAPYRLISADTFPEEDLNEADRLSFYLQIIYTGIPRIRKEVDMKFKKNKLLVYEKIIDRISKKYGHLFSVSNDEQYLFKVLRNIRKPENYELKQKIINEARDIIRNMSLSEDVFPRREHD